MPSPGPQKHFIFAFIIALVVYIVSYSWIEHRRTRHGPWQITFTTYAGAPALVINETRLQISNFTVTFPGQPAPFTNSTISFDPPQPVPFHLPFGECIFMDTTFQPGSLVFVEFDHEIQLLPRMLTVDKREYAWQSGAVIVLTNAPKRLNKADTSPAAP